MVAVAVAVAVAVVANGTRGNAWNRMEHLRESPSFYAVKNYRQNVFVVCRLALHQEHRISLRSSPTNTAFLLSKPPIVLAVLVYNGAFLASNHRVQYSCVHPVENYYFV